MTRSLGKDWLTCVALLISASPSAADQSSDVRAALESAAVRLRDGRPAEALRVLEPVEQVEPDNPWLWYYRGVARYQLREPYRALECYDRALTSLMDAGDPDPALTDQVRQDRAKARREVFGLSLQIGLAYDSNVSFLGDSGTLDVVAGRGDGRFSTSFSIDYAPVADAKQVLAVGLRTTDSWHFAIEQFDYQDYGGYVRYARRPAADWEVSLQYDYDFSYLGNDPFLSNHAITPQVTYTWNKPGRFRLDTSTLYYQFQAQDFRFDVDRRFDRDGLVHSVGFEQSFQVEPLPELNWTWDLSAGYRFDSYLTQGREFDRLAHNFFISAAVPLMNPFQPEQYLILPDNELLFRFSALWQMENYRNKSLTDHDRDDRSDLITTLSFGLSQTLFTDPEAGDLVLHAIINWTDAQSNITMRNRLSPFTYDKLVFGVQLVWSF